jgi:hypothetical protein
MRFAPPTRACASSEVAFAMGAGTVWIADTNLTANIHGEGDG